MKNLTNFLSILLLLTFMSPIAMAGEAKDRAEKPDLTIEEQARMEEIEQRVEEIRAMEFSGMSKEELRDVRTELKELKREAKQNGGGIYLSVGAIIIILLILILIT